MLVGILLYHWNESHKESPIPAMKDEWMHPGDTHVLKTPEGACQETNHTGPFIPWTFTSASQALQTGRP